MKQYKGTGVSPGIAIGQVHVLKKTALIPEKRTGKRPEVEMERFEEACARVADELIMLSKKVEKEAGEKEAEILVSHSRIALDRSLKRETLKLLEAESANAEWALHQAAGKIAERLAAMKDPLFSARADDIRDVSGKIMRHLMGIADETSQVPTGSVVVSELLLPSDTLTFTKGKVSGFVTAKGGFASHVAILARSLEIPAVVGISEIHELAADGEKLALDGETGEITLSPDDATIELYNKRLETYEKQKDMVAVYKKRRTETFDGKRLHVEANIGSLADIDAAIAYGCEGVGLFRTEFLFMEKDRLPTEDEQYEIYSKAAKKLGKHPLIIRTLDIGGDKPVDYLNIEKEENPFMGLRAIRYSLANKPVFIQQVRAILRASVSGNVQMMLPMITSLEELIQAKQIINETAVQLESDGIPYANVPVGIMIEVPAAAVMADVFAEYCDFFSIGTNDLIQYTAAVDRGNSSVAHLYSNSEPAVLRLVHYVIKCAREKGIRVAMCGEAAGYLPLVPVLVAMGLDAFSVSAPLIPSIRAAIHKTDTKESERLLSLVQGFTSATDAEKTLSQGND